MDIAKGDFDQLRLCLLQSSVNPRNIIGKNPTLNNSSMKYDDLNYQWQLQGGLIYPLGYLMPTNAGEIQAAVLCARRNNVSVVPKCGGHSYGKYAFGDEKTLVIDMQLLDEVTMDFNNTYRATIGPGSLTGHMGWKLWTAAQKILPIGICPTVGISGLSLGGGHGYLARTYGLMMDNVIEMEVIDADGQLLKVNSEENRDLFWAMKGAGGGSYGIVSKFTFRVHDAPSEVIYLINYYSLDKFPEVFDNWQRFVKANQWNIVSTALHVKGSLVHLEFVVFQTKESSLDPKFVLKLFATTFPPSDSNSIDFLSYPKFVLKMAHRFGMIKEPPIIDTSDLINITRHSFDTSYMRAKSFYARELISMEDLKVLGKVILRLPPRAVLYFLSYGGVINYVDTDESSFIHRNGTLYHCEMVQYGTIQDDHADFPWLNEFFKVSRQVMGHNESYQNYVDDELKNYLTRYYGHNLKALIEIKNKYDPDNFFHNPMSIPTVYNDNMSMTVEYGTEAAGKSNDTWSEADIEGDNDGGCMKPNFTGSMNEGTRSIGSLTVQLIFITLILNLVELIQQ